MLPNFTKAKVAIKQKFNDYFDSRIRYYNPQFSEADVSIVHEGTGTETVNADSNFHHEMTFEKTEASVTTTIDELINDPLSVFKMIDEMAKQTADQQAKIIYDTISDVTEKSGNVTRRKGKVTPETIFEMYEKVLIAFDDEGNPQMPQIHAGTNMLEEIESALKQIQTDSKLSKQFNELMERKKKNWNDRENNRKLVG